MVLNCVSLGRRLNGVRLYICHDGLCTSVQPLSLVLGLEAKCGRCMIKMVECRPKPTDERVWCTCTIVCVGVCVRVVMVGARWRRRRVGGALDGYDVKQGASNVQGTSVYDKTRSVYGYSVKRVGSSRSSKIEVVIVFLEVDGKNRIPPPFALLIYPSKSPFSHLPLPYTRSHPTQHS